MTSRPVMPFTLVQVQRWRVSRLIEMIQREYSKDELVAELQAWTATGIERIPPAFNLGDAALRAAYARTSDGTSLKAVLPCDENGRLSGPSRDVIESAIYAALAPHIPQLDVDDSPLRSYQPEISFLSPENSVQDVEAPADTTHLHERSCA